MIKVTSICVIVTSMILVNLISCCANETINLVAANKGTLVNMKINIANEYEIQTKVDQGHQPWRLVPVDVAFSEVASDPKVTYESCSLVKQVSAEAKVKCKGTHVYFIQLKQLVKPNGIWTATSVQIE